MCTYIYTETSIHTYIYIYSCVYTQCFHRCLYVCVCDHSAKWNSRNRSTQFLKLLISNLGMIILSRPQDLETWSGFCCVFLVRVCVCKYHNSWPCSRKRHALPESCFTRQFTACSRKLAWAGPRGKLDCVEHLKVVKTSEQVCLHLSKQTVSSNQPI